MNSRPPIDLPYGAHHHHRHNHHHHQRHYREPPPRYVPSSHPPHFHEAPNIHSPHHHYHHHHHHHGKNHQILPPPTPPPPPPIPPLPQSYHPLPPPPPLQLQQHQHSQFDFRSFDPVEDDRHRRPVCHHDNRRLSDRLPPDLGFSADVGRSSFSRIDLDHDSRYRMTEHRPASPYCIRHNSDTLGKFRHGYVDEVVTDGQGDFPRSLLSSSLDVHGLVNYSDLYSMDGGDGLSEKHGRLSHRQVSSADLRGLVFDSRHPETDDVEGLGFVSGEVQFREPELGRYNYGTRRSSRGVQDYNVSPKKPMQKKSAFLRLQLPRTDRRSGDDERPHSFNHHDEKSSGSFRGKGPLVSADHSLKQMREGKSMELDVSFKSNSLVAKPIVAPSSCVTFPDKELTPSKRLKNIDVSNRESTSSLMENHEDSAAKSSRPSYITNDTLKNSESLEEGDVEAFDCASKGNSQPVSKQNGKVETVLVEHGPAIRSGTVENLNGKVNEIDSKGTIASGKDGTCISNGKDIFPKACTAASPGNIDIVDKESNSACANREPAGKVVKKKKVVKKVVKRAVKIVDPCSEMPTSKPVKSNAEQMKTDSSNVTGLDKGMGPSEDTCSGLQHFHDVGANDGLNEVCASQTEDAQGTSQGTLLVEWAGDTGNGQTALSHDKRENSGSCSPIHSTLVEGEIKARYMTSNCTFTGPIISQNLLTSPVQNDFESRIEKFSPLLGNGATSVSTALGDHSPSLFTSDDMNLDGGSIGVTSPSQQGFSATTSDEAFVRSHELRVGSGMRVLNPAGSVPCTNQVIASDSGIAGKMQKTVASDSDYNSSANLEDLNRDDHWRPSMDLPMALDIPRTNQNSPNVAFPGDSPKHCPTSVNCMRKDGISQLYGLSSRIEETGVETANISCYHPSDSMDSSANLSVKELGSQLDTALCAGHSDLGLFTKSHGHDAHENKSLDKLPKVTGSVNHGIDVCESGDQSSHRKKRTSSPCHSFPGLTTNHKNEVGLLGDSSASCSELQSSSCDSFIQPDVEVVTSSTCVLHGSSLSLRQEGNDTSLSSATNMSVDNKTQLQQSGFDLRFPVEASNIPDDPSRGQLISKDEQKEKFLLGDTMNEHCVEVPNSENRDDEKVDLHSVEQMICGGEMADYRLSFSHLVPKQGSPSTVMESDSDIHMMEESPSVSPYVPSSADGDGIYNSNSCDEAVESVHHPAADTSSPENMLNCLGVQNPSWESSGHQVPRKKLVENGKEKVENLLSGGGSDTSILTLSSHSNKVHPASDCAIEGDLPSTDKEANLPAVYSLKSAEPYGGKSQPNQVTLRPFPGHSSIVYKTSKMTSSRGTTKSNTWHRTSTSSAPLLKKPDPSSLSVKRHFARDTGKCHNTSYIRKGNCLVRQPGADACQSQLPSVMTSAALRKNSSGVSDIKRSLGTIKRDTLNGKLDLLGTGGANVPFARPKTPLVHVGDLSSKTTRPFESCTSSNSVGPLLNGCIDTRLDEANNRMSNDVLKTSENAMKASENSEDQTCSTGKLESLKELLDENLSTSGLKRITYVKCKSNQLVAKTTSFDLPTQAVDHIRNKSSDGYYKRNQNQLIRASIGCHINQMSAISDGVQNSEGQAVPKVSSRSILNRSLSHKVWTLCGSKLPRRDKDPLYRQKCCQKVLPQLFPWKRATYWRKYKQIDPNLDDRSSSAIRRLLMLRKREAIYVRSKHGLSLRKAKVVSVGGSSLKWSKSIERRSKKANEEATRAVVAAEREKKEQNSALSVSSKTKGKSCSSHDESSCSPTSQTKLDAKKSYVPKRLVIGNDEYVRIGNGNQLIRDPKKRTRILASEKVRWSLHTARMRLAKKRKYCQFFTRFGKCNKDDGKCPYIHDPSKIAVCTKFINDLCSDKECKLTHEIIPERMPDCSFFLQGLCTNKSCPYRHVKVNQSSPTCEAFLRGYCADGNECCKKHSYVCPTFESTGRCPKGSKCKLHHPKSHNNKGKKRKRSREKNSQGRYFGFVKSSRLSEPGVASHKRVCVVDSDPASSFSDFISLDVSEGEESDNETDELMICDESDTSNVQLDDLLNQIKPVGIMDRTLVV